MTKTKETTPAKQCNCILVDRAGMLQDIQAMRLKAEQAMYNDTWQAVARWMVFIDDCWKAEIKLRQRLALEKVGYTYALHSK